MLSIPTTTRNRKQDNNINVVDFETAFAKKEQETKNMLIDLNANKELLKKTFNDIYNSYVSQVEKALEAKEKCVDIYMTLPTNLKYENEDKNKDKYFLETVNDLFVKNIKNNGYGVEIKKERCHCDIVCSCREYFSVILK